MPTYPVIHLLGKRSRYFSITDFVRKALKEKKFDECLKELNEVAVVSNNNYDVFELYLKASLELFKRIL